MGNSLIRTVCRRVVVSVAVSLVAGPLMVTSAFAKDMTPQQEKMSACAKQNKGKKGDDYKQSQTECLKTGPAMATAPMTQQEKMAMCSKQNKGKKGDDYKKSQSDCLKG